MEVIIAGAGSIGLLLGSFLSQAEIDVTFYARREEQVDLIRKNGIERINQDGTRSVCRVAATTDIRKLPAGALWIIAVKYAGLRSLLSDMQVEQVNNPVLFIQNGIGHMELVTNTTLPHTAFATVEHGAQRIDDRTVSHNGIGKLTIATARGDENFFTLIGQAHSDAFPVVFHRDAEQIIMRKVLINCMINPLTAILNVENGELLTNKHCHTLFNTLFDELMNAFPEMQSNLSYEAVADICRKTARNRSSMLTDCTAGRPMEIETIVSAVIRKANERDESLPLLTTLETMLYAIDRKEEE